MFLTWIGWGGKVPWLPGSPDLNTMGTVKSDVHSTRVNQNPQAIFSITCKSLRKA